MLLSNNYIYFYIYYSLINKCRRNICFVWVFISLRSYSPPEDIANCENGIFKEDIKLKCYMFCLLEEGSLVSYLLILCLQFNLFVVLPVRWFPYSMWFNFIRYFLSLILISICKIHSVFLIQMLHIEHSLQICILWDSMSWKFCQLHYAINTHHLANLVINMFCM